MRERSVRRHPPAERSPCVPYHSSNGVAVQLQGAESEKGHYSAPRLRAMSNLGAEFRSDRFSGRSGGGIEQ